MVRVMPDSVTSEAATVSEDADSRVASSVPPPVTTMPGRVMVRTRL